MNLVSHQDGELHYETEADQYHKGKGTTTVNDCKKLMNSAQKYSGDKKKKVDIPFINHVQYYG